MLQDSYLSKFEIFLLWRVLLYGPINSEVLAEDLGVPQETTIFFIRRLESKQYLERDMEYAKTRGYHFVASYRRDSKEDNGS